MALTAVDGRAKLPAQTPATPAIISLYWNCYYCSLSPKSLRRVVSFVYLYLFFHPFYYTRPFFLSSSLVVPQIRGHIVASSPHSPLRCAPCIFIARRLQSVLPA